MKLIPIYTQNFKERQNFTIFIDKQTNRTYKAYQKELSQKYFWIAFFPILALLRGIKDISPSISNLMVILFILCLVGIGIISGMLFYKKFVYEELREIYFTEAEVKDYIERGEKVFKLEVSIALISFCIVLLLVYLFFVFKNIVFLIFMFFSMIFFIVYLCRLPLERIKLYI